MGNGNVFHVSTGAVRAAIKSAATSSIRSDFNSVFNSVQQFNSNWKDTVSNSSDKFYDKISQLQKETDTWFEEIEQLIKQIEDEMTKYEEADTMSM